MDDDLHLAPAEDRSPLKAILIAVGILAVVTFAVFWFNPHKVATAKVTGEQLVATHTEVGSLTSKGASAMPGGMRVIGPKNAPQTATEDNLYVVANVHVDNKLRLPIFITGADATLTDAQGQQIQGREVIARDVPRLVALFPQLAPLVPHPITDGEQAAPGASAEGQVVFLFPAMNEAAWHAKRSATLTLELAHQDPLTTLLP